MEAQAEALDEVTSSAPIAAAVVRTLAPKAQYLWQRQVAKNASESKAQQGSEGFFSKLAKSLSGLFKTAEPEPEPEPTPARGLAAATIIAATTVRATEITTVVAATAAIQINVSAHPATTTESLIIVATRQKAALRLKQ